MDCTSPTFQQLQPNVRPANPVSATSPERECPVLVVKKKKKKKIRRGGAKRFHKNKAKHFKNCASFTIYHNNIRGFESKRVSLKSIVSHINADVLTLNETNFKNGKKMYFDGFSCFNKNRQNTNMGGVATTFCYIILICIKLSKMFPIKCIMILPMQ